ncbi:MAG: diacylglycerol kinase family protein [Candidatus Pacebacteria bacterium]|nr:diacylglycerol kinase family protein [Candidatus Paceibacterota bacterium]
MKRLIKSFLYAINGIYTVWLEEASFRIQVWVTIAVIALGIYLKINFLEWIILINCIVAVLSAEMINTAIEDLCNKVEPKTDPLIGKIKDITSGFVLVVAIGALVIGVILFSRHF